MISSRERLQLTPCPWLGNLFIMPHLRRKAQLPNSSAQSPKNVFAFESVFTQTLSDLGCEGWVSPQGCIPFLGDPEAVQPLTGQWELNETRNFLLWVGIAWKYLKCFSEFLHGDCLLLFLNNSGYLH